MKRQSRTTLAFVLFPLLVAACSQRSATQPSPADGTAGAGPQTALGRMAANAIGEARVKLAKENINLNGQFYSGNGHHTVVAGVGHKDPADTRPDAELTPTGDLLIDGKPVPVTPAQHAMLVQYRQQIMTVAEAGMAVGVEGADLGGQAVSEVFKGLMSGNTDQIDRNINAKARKIEAKATQLCNDLRPLQQMQQQLATTLPAFAPYATLKESDIDDCGHHSSDKVTVRTSTDADRTEIRDDIRNEIREGIRGAVRGDTQAAAAPASKPPSAPAAR